MLFGSFISIGYFARGFFYCGCVDPTNEQCNAIYKIERELRLLANRFQWNIVQFSQLQFLVGKDAVLWQLTLFSKLKFPKRFYKICKVFDLNTTIKCNFRILQLSYWNGNVRDFSPQFSQKFWMWHICIVKIFPRALLFLAHTYTLMVHWIYYCYCFRY